MYAAHVETIPAGRSAGAALWPRVERLGRGDATPAASVLAKAFSRYPLVRYLFEGRGEQETLVGLEAMFAYLIASRFAQYWPTFACRVGRQIVGVAVLSEPDGREAESPELGALWEAAARAMGERAVARYSEYAAICEATKPAGAYHYLGILGVLPELQGFGYGRMLLEASKAEARALPGSRGVALNTEAMRNLTFYEGSGFEIFGAADVGPLQTWTLRWEIPIDERIGR